MTDDQAQRLVMRQARTFRLVLAGLILNVGSMALLILRAWL